MNHGTTLLAGITLIVAATPISAGEPAVGALPLPTGMAAMKPQVPPPGANGAMSVESAGPSWRDRFSNFSSSLFGKPEKIDCVPFDPLGLKRQWCTDCAPAVRHPLPPLPGGVTTAAHREHVRPVAAPEPACQDGHAGHGSCWEKYKTWLCFRYTPVHLPCTPTPRYAPLYTYVPCRENAGGVGVGCDFSRAGLLHHRGRATGTGCSSCPAPAEAILPGYRLAASQGPAVPPAAP